MGICKIHIRLKKLFEKHCGNQTKSIEQMPEIKRINTRVVIEINIRCRF